MKIKKYYIKLFGCFIWGLRHQHLVWSFLGNSQHAMEFHFQHEEVVVEGLNKKDRSETAVL